VSSPTSPNDSEDVADAPAAGIPIEETPAEARTMSAWLKHHAADLTPTRHPAYRRLLIGQTTSFIGAMLTQVAVPVQVYDLTNSSLQVGFVGLAGLIPIVSFGLYGGAIADAVDRRQLYIWASLISWIMTIALLVQAAMNVGSVGLILGFVAVQSGAFAMAGSARGAIIPRIVPREEVPAANTLQYTAGNIGQVVGPLIAGVLVTRPHGFVWAYGADAVLFTAALYSVLRLPPIPPQGTSMGVPGLRSVVDGLRYIIVRPVLAMSFGVDILAMVLAMPRSLFPAVAAMRFPGDVGWLYAAIAIGALIAGVTSGWIGRIKRPGVALTAAVVGWGVTIAGAGLAHQLWLVVVLLAVAGGADLVSGVYRQTILQTYAPDEMRGRLQGVFIAVVAGGPRLGDVRAGTTAAIAGVTFSWVAGGIACAILAAILSVAVRSFWHYDGTAPADNPDAHPSDSV
jgi:MFS family permease